MYGWKSWIRQEKTGHFSSSVNASSPPFALLRSPWSEAFNSLLLEVNQSLILASPFIKLSRATQVSSSLRHRGIQNKVQLIVLTDLRPENALSGATDLEALLELSKHIPEVELIYLPSLHAKVYLADRSMVIITSGNLTDGGIERNFEYGIVSTDESIVDEARRDFESYALLGAKVSSSEITALLGELMSSRSFIGKQNGRFRIVQSEYFMKNCVRPKSKFSGIVLGARQRMLFFLRQSCSFSAKVRCAQPNCTL